MTRNELPIDKQKEYDAILDECMKEIEDNVPEPKEAFDTRPDIIRRKIAEKYLPRLNRILLEAE